MSVGASASVGALFSARCNHEVTVRSGRSRSPDRHDLTPKFALEVPMSDNAANTTTIFAGMSISRYYQRIEHRELG
jgi:hypothetical protein